MNFQSEMNRLHEMLNLVNSNQDPPVDLYDLKGSNEGDNEIDSLTKEPLDTLLMEDEVISTTSAREKTNFKKSMFMICPNPKGDEVTLFVMISEESIRLLERDGETLDEVGFAKNIMEFEDISSLDPPELTSKVIDESSLLVTPLPDPKQICLREVERFDPFFSLTQLGGREGDRNPFF
ncbi:hypothetical protein Tco_0531233 [Tanacetum coccineum]